jgi:homoserine O-acetyltransferase
VREQKRFPTRDASDGDLEANFKSRLAGGLDANDLLYQVNASRNYDPSPSLEKITAQVLWMNSGDDFINPPGLRIAEREAKRLKNGKFVLILESEQTHGHGSHSWAELWKKDLQELLGSTGH